MMSPSPTQSPWAYISQNPIHIIFVPFFWPVLLVAWLACLYDDEKRLKAYLPYSKEQTDILTAARKEYYLDENGYPLDHIKKKYSRYYAFNEGGYRAEFTIDHHDTITEKTIHGFDYATHGGPHSRRLARINGDVWQANFRNRQAFKRPPAGQKIKTSTPSANAFTSSSKLLEKARQSLLEKARQSSNKKSAPACKLRLSEPTPPYVHKK
jgi:hypothetical protein